MNSSILSSSSASRRSPHGELITLQFGSYANFVGSHFWNLELQEKDIHTGTRSKNSSANQQGTGEENATGLEAEVDWRPLFRLSESQSGGDSLVQRLPRLVACDFPSSIGSLANSQEFAGAPDLSDAIEATNWGGSNFISAEARLASQRRNARTRPSGPVNAWGEFLQATLHSKSVLPITGVSDADNSFSFYSHGYDYFRSQHSLSTEFVDRVRYFAEECDQMAGFQILADSYNGFAGFTEAALEELRDDYSRSSILFYGLEEFSPLAEDFRTRQGLEGIEKTQIEQLQRRELNSLMALARLPEFCDAYYPIRSPARSPPSFRVPFAPDQTFESSAFVALAIHTNSLAFRRIGDPRALPQFLHESILPGKKILGLNVSVPLEIQRAEDDPEMYRAFHYNDARMGSERGANVQTAPPRPLHRITSLTPLHTFLAPDSARVFQIVAKQKSRRRGQKLIEEGEDSEEEEVEDESEENSESNERVFTENSVWRGSSVLLRGSTGRLATPEALHFNLHSYCASTLPQYARSLLSFTESGVALPPTFPSSFLASADIKSASMPILVNSFASSSMARDFAYSASLLQFAVNNWKPSVYQMEKGISSLKEEWHSLIQNFIQLAENYQEKS